jgi:hypothetical protein
MDNFDLPGPLLRDLKGEKPIFFLRVPRIHEVSDYLGKLLLGGGLFYFFLNIFFIIIYDSLTAIPMERTNHHGIGIFITGLLALLGLGVIRSGLITRNQKNIPVVATDSRILMLVKGEIKSYPWSDFIQSFELIPHKKAIRIPMKPKSSGGSGKRIYLEGLEDPERTLFDCIRMIQKAKS